MKRFLQFTPALLLLAQMSTAGANNTGYEVELIIYEDIKARYQYSEDWSYNDTLKTIQAETRKEPKKATRDPEFQMLNWDEGQLASKLKSLQNSPNFKVLANKRWKQTGLDREHSFTIKIDSQTDSAATTSKTDLVNPAPSYITGNIKLIMSRYLHFNVDLEYFKPYTDETSEFVYKMFPVVAERRMKSRETHYIDHPLVGVIVLATPYKLKTDEPAKKSQAYKTL